MVNLWPGIPTNCLCDRHLNAACNESTGLLRYHMLKNHKIDGWIKNGCIDLDTLEARIKELLNEAKARGKNWKYVLTEDFDDAIFVYQALSGILFVTVLFINFVIVPTITSAIPESNVTSASENLSESMRSAWPADLSVNITWVPAGSI